MPVFLRDCDPPQGLSCLCCPPGQARACHPRPGFPRGLFEVVDLVVILELDLVNDGRHQYGCHVQGRHPQPDRH